MTETLWDFIGWYGTIAVLGAFALCMFGVLPWGGSVFMIANLSGAAALVIANLIKRNWYVVVFYLIWGIVTAMKYFNIG
jgi:hypothetical protein